MPLYVSLAPEAEDLFFETNQPDPAESSPVHASRRGEQIEVRDDGGHLEAIHQVAAPEQRPIVGLAVERDEQSRGGQALANALEQRTFLPRPREKELLDHETLVFEPTEASQKSEGPGASGKSGGLGVEKEQALGRVLGKCVSARQRRYQLRTMPQGPRHRGLAMAVRGLKTSTSDVQRAERSSFDLSGKLESTAGRGGLRSPQAGLLPRDERIEHAAQADVPVVQGRGRRDL